MGFSLTEHWVWNFWLADDGHEFHPFSLYAPKSLGDPELRHRNARFGHAPSGDFVERIDHGAIFGAGEPGDFDDTVTWAGSVPWARTDCGACSPPVRMFRMTRPRPILRRSGSQHRSISSRG